MRLLAIGLATTLVLGATGAPAAEQGCNRECLAGVMNSYLQAVVGHDPTKIISARNVKYTENGVRLNLGDGLWRTASAMPTYRLDVIDDEAGQVGLLGRISENGNNNWFAVRHQGGARPEDFPDRDPDQSQYQRGPRRRATGWRQGKCGAASVDGAGPCREG